MHDERNEHEQHTVSVTPAETRPVFAAGAITSDATRVFKVLVNLIVANADLQDIPEHVSLVQTTRRSDGRPVYILGSIVNPGEEHSRLMPLAVLIDGVSVKHTDFDPPEPALGGPSVGTA